MSQTSKIKVQVTHRYNVPAERVYDTLLDRTKARQFMFATPTGKMIRAEIDARIGGTFLFVERRPSGDAAHYGKYVKLERPAHIAFQFSVQKDTDESDLVAIDITPLAQGCEVTLTHAVAPEFASLKPKIEEGWDGILDGLGEALRAK